MKKKSVLYPNTRMGPRRYSEDGFKKSRLPPDLWDYLRDAYEEAAEDEDGWQDGQWPPPTGTHTVSLHPDGTYKLARATNSALNTRWNVLYWSTT